MPSLAVSGRGERLDERGDPIPVDQAIVSTLSGADETGGQMIGPSRLVGRPAG